METSKGPVILMEDRISLAWNQKDFLKFAFLSLLLLCLVVFWLGFGEHGFVHLHRMEKERQTYLERISHLERDNQELMAEIQRLRTDRDYMESMGRKELGLIRNDETLYRFERKKEPSLSPEEPGKETGQR